MSSPTDTARMLMGLLIASGALDDAETRRAVADRLALDARAPQADATQRALATAAAVWSRECEAAGSMFAPAPGQSGGGAGGEPPPDLAGR